MAIVAVSAMIGKCDALGRGCCSFVPVRVLMSEEGDDDAEASDDGGKHEVRGWVNTRESDDLEECCDRITSCYASGDFFRTNLRNSSQFHHLPQAT